MSTPENIKSELLDWCAVGVAATVFFGGTALSTQWLYTWLKPYLTTTHASQTTTQSLKHTAENARERGIK